MEQAVSEDRQRRRVNLARARCCLGRCRAAERPTDTDIDTDTDDALLGTQGAPRDHPQLGCFRQVFCDALNARVRAPTSAAGADLAEFTPAPGEKSTFPVGQPAWPFFQNARHLEVLMLLVALLESLWARSLDCLSSKPRMVRDDRPQHDRWLASSQAHSSRLSRVHTRTMMCACAVVVLAGCSGEPESGSESTAPSSSIAPSASIAPSSSTAPTAGLLPTVTGSSQPLPQFETADKAIASLVTAQAAWHAPKELTVDKPTPVALTLGGSPDINATIHRNVPNTTTMPAGSVQVGPDVLVTLEADPSDAVVTPAGQVSDSTGGNVALYYQWNVRPLHPASSITLTASVVIPLTGTSHTITTPVVLTLPVADTWSHRADQVFTNWGTWSAIGLAVFGGGSWLWKKRRLIRSVPATGNEQV